MTARAALTVVGTSGALIAVYRVTPTMTSLLIWVAIFAVLVLAIVALIKIGHGQAAGRVNEKRVRRDPVKDIVERAEESRRIDDTIRAGTGFDGSVKLALIRGTLAKAGHGTAHVRFNDVPQHVHPVVPGTPGLLP